MNHSISGYSEDIFSEHNSFHMKFEAASNLDLDSGGNTLTFSTTGSPTQTLDCPSNNFATWNPLLYQI